MSGRYSLGRAWYVNAGENHLDVMSRKPGAFHRKHGKNVQLLEEDTVARRVGGSSNVVFTEEPIPQGSMFQVKVLDYEGGRTGYIVSGV